MADNKWCGAILLASIERGRALAENLSSRGIDAMVVESSEELHRALKQRRADFLVIQQLLDGFLTGLEIVERLQANLSCPAVVLVGTLTPAEREVAERLGVGSVIDGETRIDELEAAVICQLSQLSANPSAIPQMARRLAAETDVIRPLPQLLTKLCGYLQDDTLSLPELATDISVDPRVTAELLKITNSASAGLARTVSSVREAVVLLGIRQTIATVLSTGVLDAQASLLKTLPDQIHSWYQTRSLLIGCTAAAFAERMEHLSAETAYVLGLFQDLGILVLANAIPSRYQHVLQRAMTIGQVRLEQLEREEFGITHADVSAALLERWEVPKPIVAMVLDHHLPERQGDHVDTELRFLHVMRIAEAVANVADVSSPHRHRALAVLLERYGTRRGGECKACIGLGVTKAAEQSELFSLPRPDQAVLQKLLEQFGDTAQIADQTSEKPSSESSLPTGMAAGTRHSQDGTSTAPVSDARQQSDPADRNRGRRQRVLVIDDEVAIVKMIGRLLDAAGFEVVACCNPDDAPALSAGVDIVLCDVHLGNTTGMEVILRLRRLGVEAPVIMVSGDRTRETVVECFDAGIVDYVIKPFSRAVLVEKLTKHLAKKPSLVAAAVAG
jgi:HD-like signal output (HDOD) protein/PleD family two-component response regulator